MAKVKRNFPLYSTLLHFSSLLLKTLCFPLATYWLIDIYSDDFFLIPHKELYPYLMICSTIFYAPDKWGQALRAMICAPGKSAQALRAMICAPGKSAQALRTMICAHGKSGQALRTMICARGKSAQALRAIIYAPDKSGQALRAMI